MKSKHRGRTQEEGAGGLKKMNQPVHDGALIAKDGHDRHHVEHSQEGGA